MKSSQNNLRLLLETKNDQLEVEKLLDLVFTPRRKLLSSYHLRGSSNKVENLSFVIKDNENNVVGTLRFWKVQINKRSGMGLLLGPLAVHPIYQNEGLGEKLVSNGLEQAYANYWNWVVLVGDIGYYSKFGFSKNVTNGISIGNELDNERLLGLDINESFLNGAVGRLIKPKKKLQ